MSLFPTELLTQSKTPDFEIRTRPDQQYFIFFVLNIFIKNISIQIFSYKNIRKNFPSVQRFRVFSGPTMWTIDHMDSVISIIYDRLDN